MKKIISFSLYAVLILILISTLPFSGKAYDSEGISEDEFKIIILNAFNFYYKYQFSEDKIIIRKDDISKEAMEIYTSDIADNMWMKRCYGSTDMPLYKEYKDRIKNMQAGINESESESKDAAILYYTNIINQLYGNNGLTFIDNNDGTVTIMPFAKSIMDWTQFKDEFWGIRPNSTELFWEFVISTEYSSDYFSDNIRPKKPNDIIIRNLKTSTDSAEADIMIYQNNTIYGYCPVWMNVSLSKIDNEWKISGGELTFVLSDWSKIRDILRKDFQSHSNISIENSTLWRQNTDTKILHSDISDHMLISLASVIANYGSMGLNISDVVESAYYAGGFKFIEQKGNKAVFLIEYIPYTFDYECNYYGEYDRFKLINGVSQGYYTAEFTYDPDFTYYQANTPGYQSKGGWKLTGGEWLYISEKNTPNTADNSCYLLICLTLSVLLSRIIIKKYFN